MRKRTLSEQIGVNETKKKVLERVLLGNDQNAFGFGLNFFFLEFCSKRAAHRARNEDTLLTKKVLYQFVARARVGVWVDA